MNKYKAYPQYKDSGVVWLGKVPESWMIQRFKNLFQIKKRIVGKLGYDVLSITQKGIQIKNIESGEGQLSSDYSKYQHVKKGDFAMNHMDLLTGFVDLSLYDGVTSPDYRVFGLVHKQSIAEYYLYLLQMGYHDKLFYPFGQGASQLGRWRLPREAFDMFLAPCPPKDEQIAISIFLNKETRKIDTLIEKQQELLRLLKEKREAAVHKVLYQTKSSEIRLDVAVDQIHRSVNRKTDDIYVALGLYNRGRGLFHKKPKLGSVLGDSDFYWIENGDLIISGQFAWEGSVALASKEENGCIVSHRYPILRGKKNILNTVYLWAFFTTRTGDFLLNEHSRGSAGRNRPLNINTLMKEKIPVPPMELQIHVAKIVKAEQDIKTLVEQTLTLLKERRTALIREVVTGKIDVREINEKD